MNWLRKMRRAWIAVFSRFTRHRKSTGENNITSGNSANNYGLVKLKDDVEMCGYEDVQIMWDILNKSTRRRNCRTTSDCDGGNDNGNAFTLFFGRHTIDPVPLLPLSN